MDEIVGVKTLNERVGNAWRAVEKLEAELEGYKKKIEELEKQLYLLINS